MEPTPEDLAIGRGAYQETKRYERLKKGFLLGYLTPMCWLANSVVRYQLKDTTGTRFQIIFWLVIFFLTILFIRRRKRAYLKSLDTLGRLRTKYGADISFGDEPQVIAKPSNG
jgi:hypothetical protein